MDGALIIDKPAGLTSHDVVAKVRRILREKSVGHLGTLDPLATGVLPLLAGRLTRLARFFQTREKEYEGEIRFGFATDTYDAAGEQRGERSERAPDPAAVQAAMGRLTGRSQQVPPPYSAKKIGGTRAYELARREQNVKLAPVEVEVFEFSCLALQGQALRFRVRCSSGTYVRTLAHDLGQLVGIPAHLQALRRTRVGEFDITRALTIQQLEQKMAGNGFQLIPATELLPELPAVIAAPDACARILNGQAVNLPQFSPARLVRVFAPDQRLIAVASRVAGTLFQPIVVFPRE
jgi:tRNA pseudouridine55 synthase